MKIATFNSLESATTKLAAYNILARHETDPEDFTLVDIAKHTTDNVWWFNFDACVENGGMHKADIAADEANLSIVVLSQDDLITQGYLPQPQIGEY